MTTPPIEKRNNISLLELAERDKDWAEHSLKMAQGRYEGSDDEKHKVMLELHDKMIKVTWALHKSADCEAKGDNQLADAFLRDARNLLKGAG